MKRWLFLLAVPYVVVSPDGPKNCIDYDGKMVACLPFRLGFKGNILKACVSEEECQDLAFALNEAHEKRVKENPYDGLTKQQAIDLLKDKDVIIEQLRWNSDGKH